jgi:hypothetical protein
VLLPAGLCFAVDATQKLTTCKFGADQQRLQGEARDVFLKKCIWRIGTIRAAQRLPDRLSDSAKTCGQSHAGF